MTIDERNQVLEDAARACDEREAMGYNEFLSVPLGSSYVVRLHTNYTEARACAAAIRTLMQEKPDA